MDKQISEVEQFVLFSKHFRWKIFIHAWTHFKFISFKTAESMAQTMAVLAVIDPNNDGVEEEKLVKAVMEFNQLAHHIA